ncbi:MAG: hypothetical protein EB084_01170 [Proteobacteria bacterium]|nr:hypothetical protein [Pseudomonadota bacterium]
MQTGNRWLWVGVGALGLALTSALVVRHYRHDQRRARASNDPRAQQVRALIEEAEKLLVMGRRGSTEAL